jgi:hypothetical protein
MSKVIEERTEEQIKNATLLLLGKRKDILCWNNPTGVARAVQPPHPFITYGLKGSSDIIGAIAPFGNFFGIECKTLKGEQRESQTRFELAVRKVNGIYIVGRNSRQALIDLLTERKKFADSISMGHLIDRDLELLYGW